MERLNTIQSKIAHGNTWDDHTKRRNILEDPQAIFVDEDPRGSPIVVWNWDPRGSSTSAFQLRILHLFLNDPHCTYLRLLVVMRLLFKYESATVYFWFFYYQRRQWLGYLARRLPSSSPLCKDWPPCPRRFTEASILLRKLHHKWRVRRIFLCLKDNTVCCIANATNASFKYFITELWMCMNERQFLDYSMNSLACV